MVKAAESSGPVKKKTPSFEGAIFLRLLVYFKSARINFDIT